MRQETGREATLHEMQLYDTSGRKLRMTDFVDDPRVDLRFGTDSDRNLYLLAKANGKVWKVVGTKNGPYTSEVDTSLRDNLVAYYDFEHPFAQDGAVELDQGSSDTLLNLVNGGWDSRVQDGAFPGSNNALKAQQVNPTANGNDDWKAGVWNQNGVPTLSAFKGAKQATVMGWFKTTGPNPSPNTVTANPNDYYNAVGLAGVLSKVPAVAKAARSSAVESRPPDG